MLIIPIFFLIWINGIIVTSQFSLMSSMVNKVDQSLTTETNTYDNNKNHLPVAIPITKTSKTIRKD